MLTKELKGATARPHGPKKQLQGFIKPEQPKSPAASPAASGRPDPNIGSLLELQQGLETPTQPTQVHVVPSTGDLEASEAVEFEVQSKVLLKHVR